MAWVPRRGGHASASGLDLPWEAVWRCSAGVEGTGAGGPRATEQLGEHRLLTSMCGIGPWGEHSLHSTCKAGKLRHGGGGQSAELDAPPACPLWAEGSLPQAHLRYPFRYARAQMWALSPLQPNPSSTAQSPPWGGPGSSVGGTRAERPCRASAVPTQHWSVGTGRMCKGTDSLGQVSLPTPGSRNF